MNENHAAFIAEAQDVLRAGLEASSWVSVDDTGARHAGRNGFCRQIGNEWFTSFRTASSKSRLNFLDLLRAGHTDDVLNDAAYAHMRANKLSAASIALLAAGPQRFADQDAWLSHLDRLSLTALTQLPHFAFEHRFRSTACRPFRVLGTTGAGLWCFNSKPEKARKNRGSTEADGDAEGRTMPCLDSHKIGLP